MKPLMHHTQSPATAEASTKVESASHAPVVVELESGLIPAELVRVLLTADRWTDVGHRQIAFYLADMDARGIHLLLGFASAVQFAVQRLDFGKRKAQSLIAAGRALTELPKIDAAFCEGRLRWARVRLILRVVRPPVEQEWLDAALRMTWAELERAVMTSEPGRAPRADALGLPAIKVKVVAKLDPVAYETFELARRKLGDERGDPVSETEFVTMMSDLVLGRLAPSAGAAARDAANEAAEGQDGRDNGENSRTGASVYRVTVERCPDCHRSAVLTEGDRVPLDEHAAECVDCDAAAGGSHADVPTSASLRARVLARDGDRCRACSSPRSLQAHHIRWRSEGGPTTASNLACLCGRCHSMVHQGLLFVEGEPPHAVRILDRDRQPLSRPIIHAGMLVRCVPAAGTGTVDSPAGGALATASAVPAAALRFDDVPAAVDAAWLARHAASFRWNERRGEMQFEAGVAPDSGVDEAGPAVGSVAASGDSEDARRAQLCAARAARPADRPAALTEIVGQRDVVRLLDTAVRAANRRGSALDHALFFGPPGVGKTTVAELLAFDLGSEAKTVNAPTLTDPGVLLRLLTGLKPRDVLFIDEIHALPTRLAETLYEAMEERRVSFAVSDGRRTRTLTVRLAPFTLVGATTEAGRLPAPFESRFALQAFFAPYEVADLTEILARAALRTGVAVEDAAATTLAAAARGSARTALALFRRALDRAQLCATDGRPPRIDGAAAVAALEALTLDERGLKAVDRRALDALVVRGRGQPVGLARWSALAGLDAATLRRTCEPVLLDAGLIRIGPRGRTATSAALADAGRSLAAC